MAAMGLRQRAWLPLALCVVTQCGHVGGAGNSRPESQATQSDSGLAERLRALKAEFPEAQVQLTADGARVTRIRNLRAAATATRADELAIGVLKQPAVAAALGLSANLDELCPAVVREDQQLAGYALVRMEQCVGKVRVLGGVLVMSVRLEPAPAIDTLTSSLRPNIPKSVTPRLTAADAAKVVDTALKQKNPAATAGSAPAASDLVFFDPAAYDIKGPVRLCWIVRRDRVTLLVDAVDGSIAHQFTGVIQGSFAPYS
jgi:hypothetical protein